MRKPIQFVRVSMLVMAGVVLAAGVAAGRAGVTFQGFAHTAVGGAVLRIDTATSTLGVATFDPAGGDGVAVGLPQNTTSWTSRLEFGPERGAPMKLTFDAIADSRRISTASMTRTGDALDLTAVFTGGTRPTYTAAVYQDGKLVGALGSLPPTAHVYVPPHPCDTPEFRPFFNCDLYLAAKFRNTANGECVWEFSLDRPVPVRLPNGAVLTGNEVRLVEEVTGPGSYPYPSFNGMVVRTNADLTVYSETVR
jgi:hypothetical protein